jgi:hypothetical protein
MILTRQLAGERACDTQDCRIGRPRQGLCGRSGHLGQCDAGARRARCPSSAHTPARILPAIGSPDASHRVEHSFAAIMPPREGWLECRGRRLLVAQTPPFHPRNRAEARGHWASRMFHPRGHIPRCAVVNVRIVQHFSHLARLRGWNRGVRRDRPRTPRETAIACIPSAGRAPDQRQSDGCQSP